MGADSGNQYYTHARQGQAPQSDDLGSKISRPVVARLAWIGPANTAAAANLGHQIFVFFDHFRPTHISFPTFFDLLNSFLWSFLQIHHRLKDTAKKNSTNSWIEFFGHHSNLWTKVRVLMCSWSLGVSIDMWFVNFGSRLVSFPFLGHLG